MRETRSGSAPRVPTVPLSATQRSVIAVTVIGVALTGATTWSPARFVYDNSAARVQLETAQALIAFAAAGLVVGRFHRTRDRRDLLLVAGLIILGLVSLLLASLPALASVVPDDMAQAVNRWVPLAGQLLGASSIVAAALSDRSPVRDNRTAFTITGVVVGAAVLVAAALLALDDQLPAAIETLDPAGGRRPRFEPHPAMNAAYVALAVLFAIAAWAFAWRRTNEDGDGLTHAIAVGTVLASVSRVHLLLYSSPVYAHVHTGDLFRAGFFVALAAGGATSIRQSWKADTDAADLRAREQMARELHDGLTQELGFIASQTSALASGRGDPALTDHIAMAAERARNEARRMIDALEGTARPPLRTVVLDTTVPVADRDGATVRMQGGGDVHLDPRVSHEVSQIAREATANAVRHGKARTVTIVADIDGPHLCLAVRDDGVGFDRGSVHQRGFGLRSMEQRALQLGGALVIRSTPGIGSVVELTVPVLSGSSTDPTARDAR